MEKDCRKVRSGFVRMRYRVYNYIWNIKFAKREEKKEFNKKLIQDFIDFAKEERFSLLKLKPLLSDEILNNDFISEIFCIHENRCKVMEEFYNKLQRELKKQNIQSILIKDLFYFPYMSDNVDFLVEKKHGNATKSILSKLGYFEVINAREHGKFLYTKYDENYNPVSKMHLHELVGWDGVEFVCAESVFRTCVLKKDEEFIGYPSPENSFLITVAHALYENKKLNVSDLYLMREALEGSTQFDWDYVFKESKQMGWSLGLKYGIKELLSFEEKINVEDIVPQYVKNRIKKKNIILKTIKLSTSKPLLLKIVWKFMWFIKIFKDKTGSNKIKTVKTVINHMVQRRLFKVNSKRGFVIAFSGVDGSGKTTCVRKLKKYLKIKLELFSVSIVWHRIEASKFSTLIYKMYKIFHKRKIKNKKMGKISWKIKRNKLKDNKILNFIWTSVNLLDILIIYFFKVIVPLRLINKVIICDRYIVDDIVEAELMAGKGSFFSKVLNLIVPKPKFYFIMDISNEVALKRLDLKTNRGDEEFVTNSNAEYKRLGKELSSFKTIYVKDYKDVEKAILRKDMDVI